MTRLLYSKSECAESLGLLLEEVQRLIDSGELKSAMIAGREMVHRLEVLRLASTALFGTRHTKDSEPTK